MAKLHIEIPVPTHVTIDEAKSRMNLLMYHISPDIPGGVTDLHKNWHGYNASFSFKAKGSVIDGTMNVGHNMIVIDGSLPFFLGLLKGKIAKVIESHANRLLAV